MLSLGNFMCVVASTACVLASLITVALLIEIGIRFHRPSAEVCPLVVERRCVIRNAYAAEPGATPAVPP